MQFSRAAGELLSMPLGFGPAGGPRQTPPGSRITYGPTRFVRHTVSFLTRPEPLLALLPPGLQLRGEPVAQFHLQQFQDVSWLAGRSYALLSCTVPVTWRSGDENLAGQYLAVMWENLADPIITGREQCGHPKLYADLETPRTFGGVTRAAASWCGFRFAELELTEGPPAPSGAAAALAAGAGAGLFQYKHIPRTGAWDQADAAYLTFGPVPGASNLADPQPPPQIWLGEGRIRFNRPRWEDMPTQHHIVAALAGLEQLEPRPAVVLRGSAYSDGLDQRILPAAEV